MEPEDDVSARELAALHSLEGRFLTALAARDAGRLDAAEDDLREILSRPGVAQDASHVALAALMAKMAAERAGPVKAEPATVESKPTR